MLNYDFFFSVSLNLNLFYNLVISVQSKSFNFFFKNLIFLSKIYLFFFLALNRTSFIINIVCKFYLFMYFLFSYLKECKISPTIIQLKHAHFKRLICRYKTDL